MGKRTITLLLRCVAAWRGSIEWRVIDGSTGRTVTTFSQAEYGRMWLEDAGFAYVGIMAGESRAEFWTKEV